MSATRSAVEAARAPLTQRTQRGPVRAVLRFLRAKPLGAAGLALVVLFVLMAVFAPALTRYPPTSSVGPLIQPPSAQFWFGTDSLGRDVYSRTVQGSQISLVVGLSVMLINVSIGALLGMVAGFYGRWPDYLIQRSGEAFAAFPAIILYFLVIAAFGRPKTEGGNLLTIAWDLRVLILALSIGALFGGSRLIRGVTLSLKQADFVTAARTLGAGDGRILFTHLLPNVTPLVIVTATTAIGGIIAGEAALSFLGLGVSPGTPSWGADLSGRNREFFIDAPWTALAPGLAISFTVLAFNLFGDALRDVLDPRLRGSGRRR